METREISEEYAQIAAEVLSKEQSLQDIVNSHATIVYLSSDKAKMSKGKVVCAECEKVADKNKWAIPCDFTITVYEPNCIGFSNEQLYALIFHELLHVGIDFEDKNDERYYIRPHDYEDFKLIIDRYGTDWNRT